MLTLLAWLTVGIPDIRLPTTIIAREGLTDRWARYSLCTSSDQAGPLPCVKSGTWTALCYPTLYTGWGVDRDKTTGKLVSFSMRVDNGSIAPIPGCPFTPVMFLGTPPAGPHVPPMPIDMNHTFSCDKLRSVPAGTFCFDFTWNGAIYTYGIHPKTNKLHASRSRGQEVVELAPLASADAPTDQSNPALASCQALGDVDGNGAPELLCSGHEFGYAPNGSVYAGNYLWWLVDLGDSLKRLRWGMSAPWHLITADTPGTWAQPVLDFCIAAQACKEESGGDPDASDTETHGESPSCGKRLKQQYAELLRKFTDPVAQTALRGPCKINPDD